MLLALVLDRTQIPCDFSFTQNQSHYIKLLNLFWQICVYSIGSVQALEVCY